VHGPLGKQRHYRRAYVTAPRPRAAAAAAPGAEAAAAGELTQVDMLGMPWVLVSVMHECLSIDN